MKPLCVCFAYLTLFCQVNASEWTRQEYLKLIQTYPTVVQPQGSAAKGEIEIILDSLKMTEIEKNIGRDVGIVAQDKYWIWINDACLFPRGHEDIYGRILWKQSLQTTRKIRLA